MSVDRPARSHELLNLFSPRLREILLRVAQRDRRDPVQEICWLIESYAVTGRLRDAGDGDTSPGPRIPLEGLTQRSVTVGGVRVRSAPMPIDEAGIRLEGGSLDE